MQAGSMQAGEWVEVPTTPDHAGTRTCVTKRYSSQFKNSCWAEMWSGSEEGSFLRLVDRCITQL